MLQALRGLEIFFVDKLFLVYWVITWVFLHYSFCLFFIVSGKCIMLWNCYFKYMIVCVHHTVM